MEPRRLLAVLLGAAALAGGLVFALGPPRLTLTNAGLRVDYPWPQGAAGLLAAAGVGALALLASRRVLRWGLALLSAATLAFAADRLAYRLDATDAALASRGLLVETVIPWARVSRFQTDPEAFILWSDGDRRIRVATGAFRPEQRAALGRALARRIREGRRR